MKIIGLTGSIGMGKTTTAKIFKTHGIPVWSADETVHELYKSEAVPFIERQFPEALSSGIIDRQKLSDIIVKEPDALKKIEAIIHPLVQQKQNEFIKTHKENNADLILLDIPLLFETNAQSHIDVIVVVTCSPDIQRTRVLMRENMTDEKFRLILAQQLPDHEKQKLADHIVDTSDNLIKTEKQVIAIINTLRYTQAG